MKRFVSIFLALCIAAASMTACTKSPASESQPSSQAASTAQSASEPAVQEEEPYNAALLTGLEKDADYPEGRRFTAVMVNNISDGATQQARPQAGLSDADILVEIKAEGGITRFMALYENYETMPRVGPVRSARHQFFQLILPFHPMYVHVGESVVQTEYKNNYDYSDFDLNGDVLSTLGHRDSDFRARGVATEHTYVTSGEEITKTIEQFGYDSSIEPYKSTFFDFVPYNEEPRVLTGGDATSVSVVHSSGYKTYFDWDATEGKYMMSQYSKAAGAVQPSVDANNDQQLKFDNVIVLFTDIHVIPGHEAKDLQEVDYTFGGLGYYFNGGRVEPIRWQKGAADQVLRLVNDDADLTNVKVNPGRSYIAVVDLDEAENFSYSAAAASSADSAAQ